VAEFNPIGDAGYTLVSLLRDGMGELEVSERQVALVSPDQYDGDGVGLSLYLYHVDRYAHLANETRGDLDVATGEGAPLVLELYYLLTAHPPESDASSTSDTMAQHRLLSEAIRILEQNALVSGPDLKGSLAGRDGLQVSIGRQSPEHLVDLWSAFPDTAHLPSVSYVVTPVAIETAPREAADRVTEVRVDQYAEAGRPEAESER
jgi:hypothetical protein